MRDDRRDRMMENLAVAATLGFLVLVVAALGLVADSRQAGAERELLASYAGGAAPRSFRRCEDQAFSNIYGLRDGSDGLYGAVLTFRGREEGTVTAAAYFSSRGTLREIHIVGQDMSSDSAILSLSSRDGAAAVLVRAGAAAADFARAESEGRP
jgi:hypothetical protein